MNADAFNASRMLASKGYFYSRLQKPRLRRQNPTGAVNNKGPVKNILCSHKKRRPPFFNSVVCRCVPVSLGRNCSELGIRRRIDGVQIVAKLSPDKDVFQKRVNADRMRIADARSQKRSRRVRQTVFGNRASRRRNSPSRRTIEIQSRYGCD